jgi:hypothetical protein
MFIVTPYNDLKKERDRMIETQDRMNNLSVQEKVQVFTTDYNEPKGTNYLIIAIFAYLLIQSLLILFNNHLSEWKTYNLSFLISIIGLFIAFVYYYKTRNLYDYGYNGLRDYRFIINLISTIPITLITYQILRLIYKCLFNTNPKMVGKTELFTEPSNCFFTVLVITSGVVLTVFINIIGNIEKLINHFA